MKPLYSWLAVSVMLITLSACVAPSTTYLWFQYISLTDARFLVVGEQTHLGTGTIENSENLWARLGALDNILFLPSNFTYEASADQAQSSGTITFTMVLNNVPLPPMIITITEGQVTGVQPATHDSRYDLSDWTAIEDEFGKLPGGQMPSGWNHSLSPEPWRFIEDALRSNNLIAYYAITSATGGLNGHLTLTGFEMSLLKY